MPIQVLLFDVHRTLVDDRGFPRERIWQLIAPVQPQFDQRAYYQRYDELVQQLFHWPSIVPFKTIRQIHRERLAILYAEFGVRRNLDLDLDYLWSCMGTSQIYPEVPQMLAQIPVTYRVGLVSNADHDDPLIQLLLAQGYHFDAIITSEVWQCYKPDQRLFQAALQAFEARPEQALVIGDSPLADIVGARNAGLQVVWVNRSAQKLNPKYPTPDYEIQDLNALLPLLEQVAKN
ncbi:HAD family hydrolase [candidate division KSB1 bacterium]|nr:HAD family hydrolase [candidate division KSB1 bacterium]